MQEAKMMSLRTKMLLAAAAILIVAGGVGTANAALSQQSQNYTAQMELNSLSAVLAQNDVIEPKALTIAPDQVIPGKKYDENIAAVNNGEAPEYVRATIYRYWMDDEGLKDTSLDPGLISLEFADGWLPAASQETTERVVLYRAQPLAAGAKEVFLKSMTVDPDLVLLTDGYLETAKTTEGTTSFYTTTYKYNGYTVGITVQLDSVQCNNAQAAIKSAWGVDVNVSADGTLSMA